MAAEEHIKEIADLRTHIVSYCDVECERVRHFLDAS